MQKSVTVLLPTSLFFLILSILLLTGGGVVSDTVSRIGFDRMGTFLQTTSFALFAGVNAGNSKKTDEESGKAFTIAQKDHETQEMQALRDQFETSTVNTTTLLPAKIIGFEGLIPGVSRPTEILLDKGKRDGVVEGLAVIYKNNLVGKVVKTTAGRSQVALLSKSGWSFTAKTSDGKANGLVQVDDGDILLNNVVLSDELSKKEIVVTKGDMKLGGGGFPPDLVVGEITSLDKKPSALFQVAKVKSFLDVVSLTTVFIYKQ
ncbi:MAG: rod shape-determining protein MreC [bacterium]|nr:rod shape-determining protein MreC [bacterium]